MLTFRSQVPLQVINGTRLQYYSDALSVATSLTMLREHSCLLLEKHYYKRFQLQQKETFPFLKTLQNLTFCIFKMNMKRQGKISKHNVNPLRRCSVFHKTVWQSFRIKYLHLQCCNSSPSHPDFKTSSSFSGYQWIRALAENWNVSILLLAFITYKTFKGRIPLRNNVCLTWEKIKFQGMFALFLDSPVLLQLVRAVSWMSWWYRYFTLITNGKASVFISNCN